MSHHPPEQCQLLLDPCPCKNSTWVQSNPRRPYRGTAASLLPQGRRLPWAAAKPVFAVNLASPKLSLHEHARGFPRVILTPRMQAQPNRQAGVNRDPVIRTGESVRGREREIQGARTSGDRRPAACRKDAGRQGEPPPHGRRAHLGVTAGFHCYLNLTEVPLLL